MGRRDRFARCDSRRADYRAVVHNGDDPTGQFQKHSLGGAAGCAAPASASRSGRGSAHNIQAPESYLHGRKTNCAGRDSEDRLFGQRICRAGLGGRRRRRSWRSAGRTTRRFTRRNYWWHGSFGTDPTSTAARSEADYSRWFEHQSTAAGLFGPTRLSDTREAKRTSQAPW